MSEIIAEYEVRGPKGEPGPMGPPGLHGPKGDMVVYTLFISLLLLFYNYFLIINYSQNPNYIHV